mgnify:CR=1 FL=1
MAKIAFVGFGEVNSPIELITKKCKNVCSIQKKVVTLHDFSCIVE